jgi:hypothetical protein
VSARKTAYRGLYVGAKTPEPTLHEIAAWEIARAETALGAQQLQLHDMLSNRVKLAPGIQLNVDEPR